ncbi:MAG: peptide ABC transporter substrate-binding protein [Sphaerochaetaceae bacterium]
MKKVLVIALTILLVGALFISCGGKKEAAKVETPSTPVAAPAAPAAVTPAPAAPAAVTPAPAAPAAVTPAPAAPAAPAAVATPAKDLKVFKLVNGAEPESLDPHQIQGVPEHRLYEAIFEGLVAYDPKTADAIPGLAESWVASEEGTRYTFTLRDAVWSDGVKITAQTVVDSWLRELNPETASPYAWFPAMFLKGAAEYNAGTAKADAVQIRAIDDKHFQMDLLGPLPYAIGALAHYSFAVVPLHAIAKYGTEWTLPQNFVGNGPYVLKEWVPQSYIKVVPNEKYWDRAVVKLDEVIFYAIDDNNTAYNMYLNGEVDWMTTVPNDQIEAAAMRKDYHRAPQLSTYYYVFQTENAPFDDVRVRKALALGFDRQALVDQVTRAGQIPAWGIVPDMAGYAALEMPEINYEAARKLLAEAGYPNGVGFPKTTILYNTSEGHKAIAEFLQQEWKNNLNVTIELENQEWATYLSNRNAGKFQVARAGWVGDYQDPNTFLDMFITGAGMNGGKYSNELYDLYINEAARMGGADRLEVLRMAEDQMINQDQAIMPMYYYTTNNMIDTSKWGGWYPNTMDYHPTKDVYLK